MSERTARRRILWFGAMDSLIDEWIQDGIADAPERATMLGIDGYDDQLADYSAASFDRRDRRDDRWLARLEAVATDGLSLDQRIDRDLVISLLRGRAAMRDWTASSNSFSTGSTPKRTWPGSRWLA